MRGNPRTFKINGEIFTVRAIPGHAYMEFLAWRVELAKPVRPNNPEMVDEYEEYRSDFRNEFELLLDMTILTLNSSRTQDQKNRFEVSEQWLLDNVSADMLDQLVYDVCDPFLTRLHEKDIENEKKKAESMKTLLEPALREVVRDELNKIRKRRSHGSVNPSVKSVLVPDGQKNTS